MAEAYVSHVQQGGNISADNDGLPVKKRKYGYDEDPEGVPSSSMGGKYSAENEEQAQHLAQQREEFPWLPNPNLPDHLSDENYLPQGVIEARYQHPSEEDMTAFDEHIIEFMKKHRIPGLSLVIGKRREMLYTQCYGFASHGKLLESNHLFRIASVSKVLTSIAILHLYDHGKMKLHHTLFGEKGLLTEDFPLPKNFDKRLPNVMIKHLLQHSGGWDRDIAGDPIYYTHVGKEMNVQEPVSIDNLISYMLTQKLQFTPGLKYSYSNFGYLLLGKAIEKVTGMSYESYVQYMLETIGITGLCLGKTWKESKEADEVDYYAGPGGRQVDSVFSEVDCKVVAPYGGFCMETSNAFGGWLANPTQLVHIFHALEKTLLKDGTVRKLKVKPMYVKDNEDSWYGLGMNMSWKGKAWEHSGHIDGSTCVVSRNKESFTWAVCCNSWPEDSDYTSLIAYGLCLVKGWAKATPYIIPGMDASTYGGMWTFCVQITWQLLIAKTKFLAGEGFRLHWVNVYDYQGEQFLDVIWVSDGMESRCQFDIAMDNVQEVLQKQKEAGFTPSHVETYVKDGKLMCCMVLLKDLGISKLTLHHKEEAVEQEIEFLFGRGWTPKVVCFTHHGGRMNITTMYHMNQERAWVKMNMPPETYARAQTKHNMYGHMPVYVRVHKSLKNEPIFTAIWENPGPFVYTMEHDMSQNRIKVDFTYIQKEQFVPHCIAGYESEAQHKHAAVFIKGI